MKSVFEGVFKETIRSLPSETASNAEIEIQSELAKKLGNNWTDLPATGPYLMVFFVIMNYTLVPLGVTPAKITDTVIQKTKEYEIDEKAKEIVQGMKQGINTTGEFTKETIADISFYLRDKGNNIKLSESIEKEMREKKEILSTGIEKGKSVIGRLFSRKKDSNTKQV